MKTHAKARSREEYERKTEFPPPVFLRSFAASREASSTPAAFLKDLIDACVMECYFREHMAERDLLFHDTVAQILEETHAKARSREEDKSKTGHPYPVFLRSFAASREASSTPAAFLEDLIDACVMECYFREHMAERDLLFHDTVAQILEETHAKARSREEYERKTEFPPPVFLRSFAASREK